MPLQLEFRIIGQKARTLMRDQILREIKRMAETNNGQPPGEKTFSQATEIQRDEWRGKYWARWGDACAEAGFVPNSAPLKIAHEAILQKLAEAFSQSGKVMTEPELNIYRRTHPGFPSSTTIGKAFSTKSERLTKLAEWIDRNGSYPDVAAMLAEHRHELLPSIKKQEGYVYLLKSGAYYKIGRSDNIERRVKQIGQAAVEPLNQVHVIRTDDPPGIEAYWHRRFADRKTNGEWFKLTTADVQAFKRRKFQ
jgi:hypothetical protein